MATAFRVVLGCLCLLPSLSCSNDEHRSNEPDGSAGNGTSNGGGGGSSATSGAANDGGALGGFTGTGGGTAAGAGGGTSGNGGATERDASTGGSNAGAGGSIDGGRSPRDAGNGAAKGVDLTGTWISHVTAPGNLMVPVVGMTKADIDLVIRLSLTRSSGKLGGTFEICRLKTTTTPDPTSLVVTFSPAVLATLKASVSENDVSAEVGDAVPIPHVTIRSGIDAGGQQVDADKDSNPGVTVPSNIGGVIMLDAYVGLTIDVSLDGKLSSPTMLQGTTTFSTSGMVFGSSNPSVLKNGTISVMPSSPSVPFMSTRLEGDVPCAQVVTRFP